MSRDSVEQMRQARDGHYTDWHPPAMAALWRLAEHVYRGPIVMLLLQMTAFVAGLYLLLRRWLAPLPAAIATLAVAWFPPLSSTIAVIWKDSQMLGYALLGVALLARGTRRSQLAALVALAAASAMRHNAFTLTCAPVVLLFAWPGLAGWRRYAVAVAVWLGVTAFGVGVNVALTDEHKHPWTDAGQIWDVVGMVADAPPMSDDDARELLAGTPFKVTANIQQRIADAYDPHLGLYHTWDQGVLDQLATDDQRDAVDRAWWTLLREHPGAYVEHRANAFAELLQLGTPSRTSIWVGYDPIGRDLHRDRGSAFQKSLRRWQVWFGSSWLYRPWLYLAASLVLVVVVVVVCKRDRLMIALAASAVMSELPLFVIAPSSDFRYSVWLVAMTMVLAIAVAATTIRARRGRSLP
nr:hypothetical protein [Kofleriaceae bacterium]